jgi:hypothetical protein
MVLPELVQKRRESSGNFSILSAKHSVISGKTRFQPVSTDRFSCTAYQVARPFHARTIPGNARPDPYLVSSIILFLLPLWPQE